MRNVERSWTVLKEPKNVSQQLGMLQRLTVLPQRGEAILLSRFILEILPAKLSIASHEKLEVHPATRSAARMKGESEQEQDTELQKKSKELAGYIVWVGVCMVAAASELNCCHPHTF